MRLIPALVAALLLGAAGLARASECGEQIRVLDDRYSLGVVRADEGRAPSATPASGSDQSSASGTSGAASSSAGLDVVPNTGGVSGPRTAPATPLDAAQRDRLRALLADARRAEQSGDGTTCAAKVTEARHLVQGEPTEPHAK